MFCLLFPCLSGCKAYSEDRLWAPVSGVEPLGAKGNYFARGMLTMKGVK